MQGAIDRNESERVICTSKQVVNTLKSCYWNVMPPTAVLPTMHVIQYAPEGSIMDLTGLLIIKMSKGQKKYVHCDFTLTKVKKKMMLAFKNSYYYSNVSLWIFYILHWKAPLTFN